MSGILVVLCLLTFLSRWQVARMGERELNVATSRLDAQEPGWKLDAILDAHKKQAPPAEANAATMILDIGGRVPEEWCKWQQSEDAGQFWGQYSDHHLPPPDVVAAARQPAAAAPAVRNEALRLRDKKTGAYPLIVPADPLTMSLPHLDKARRVLVLLQYDAYLAALDNNPNRGIHAARAGLGVARSIGDEPLLISQLVRMACGNVSAQSAMQVVAWGEPSDGLAELQAELLAEADVPWFRNGMRGERGMLDRVFRGLEDGSIPPETWIAYCGISKPTAKGYALFRAYRPLIPGDHAKSLEIATAYLQTAKLPHHERLAAMKAIPIPKGPPDDFRYMLTRLFLPACEKVIEAGLRCRSTLLSAATCIACERFRRKNKRWPHDLSELTPAYLPAVPLNPFDGKPMTYHVLPDRIVVYCFWVDSPVRMNDLPPDFHEPGRLGFGIGFRVWNPDRCALPPREKQAP